MSLNVLVAPDKFKGTLTAHAAAAAIARGWREARPEDQLTLLPISDGGDGFGEVVSSLLGAKPQSLKTVDAARRACSAMWWWESRTKTAVVESARVIGLAMLPRGRFHPFQLDTFGLGRVLLAALRKGARRVIIGIGGSATNDGGFGLARALGWRFLDDQARPIRQWTELHCLDRIGKPNKNPISQTVQITIAVDVQNPLLGVHGATRVYGPQKGVRSVEFHTAERCLHQLARVVRTQFRRDYAKMAGAGAAGGLGFGLSVFCGGRLESGFELFAKLSSLPRQLRAADLVITGEGMIDRSSLMGKGAGEMALRCRKLKVPCIGLAGGVVRSRGQDRLFDQLRALTDLTSPERAMANAARWLERLANLSAATFHRTPASWT